MTGWTPSDRQVERLAVARRLRRRSVLVASTATVVVLGLLVVGVVSSPGWPTFKASFLDLGAARDAFPDIARGFWLNIRLFLLAEPLILLLALLVAAVRSTTTPGLAPLRLLAVVYTDLFRGLPTLLVLFVFCFGVPALRLQGLTTSLFWLALVSLVLSYGAYVAEVIRSGMDSIHPSQIASATSLGLTHGQALRYVVVPQALRRVAPPLLNDFVSLQKDTALVATVGLFDALGTASDTTNYTFNYTPLLVAAAFFVALCVPMARFTDHVGRMAMERERAGAR